MFNPPFRKGFSVIPHVFSMRKHKVKVSATFDDIFTSAEGVNSTIDTANTTAIYDADNDFYTNYNPGSPGTDCTVTRATAWFTKNPIIIIPTGVRILTETSTPYRLKTVTKSSVCTATSCSLYTDAHVLISTVSFVGDVATFNTTTENLDGSTAYRIECHSGANQYLTRKTTTTTFPYISVPAGLSETAGSQNGVDDTSYHWSFENIVVTKEIVDASTSDRLVQTNTLSASSDTTDYQLASTITTAGSATVQFKISFDDGLTWSDAKELDTKYSNSTPGTSIKIQILLNGTGSGNTATSADYTLTAWHY